MKAIFRFYEELNDFLPAWRRHGDFDYEFSEGQTVKDAIEAQGVPHPEVDLILINGESVDFAPKGHNHRSPGLSEAQPWVGYREKGLCPEGAPQFDERYRRGWWFELCR